VAKKEPKKKDRPPPFPPATTVGRNSDTYRHAVAPGDGRRDDLAGQGRRRPEGFFCDGKKGDRGVVRERRRARRRRERRQRPPPLFCCIHKEHRTYVSPVPLLAHTHLRSAVLVSRMISAQATGERDCFFGGGAGVFVVSVSSSMVRRGGWVVAARELRKVNARGKNVSDNSRP
jgi:hypothetical protein